MSLLMICTTIIFIHFSWNLLRSINLNVKVIWYLITMSFMGCCQHLMCVYSSLRYAVSFSLNIILILGDHWLFNIWDFNRFIIFASGRIFKKDISYFINVLLFNWRQIKLWYLNLLVIIWSLSGFTSTFKIMII